MRTGLQHAVPVAAPPIARPPIQMKARIGPVDDPLEREADRIADAVVAASSTKTANAEPSRDVLQSQQGRAYFEPRFRSEPGLTISAAGTGLLQRAPRNTGTVLDTLFGEDPLHAPLIEDYRRRHGSPPGGKDEFGNRVGPSDAEIKYIFLPDEFVPPCPDVKNESLMTNMRNPEHRKAFIETNCISAASQAVPPACEFTPTQDKMITVAQREASRRVQRALDRISKGGAEGRRLAQDLANRVFRGEPPKVADAVAMLNGVSGFLAGERIHFAGRSCGDPECQRTATVAYVKGPGELPIHLCPVAFSDPTALPHTILHEALHWSGLDADPATSEGYCVKFDCMTPCQDKTTADAWAHYLDCLGQPLELRRSFIDKIIESAEEVP